MLQPCIKHYCNTLFDLLFSQFEFAVLCTLIKLIVVSTERYLEDRKQERFNFYHEYVTSASSGISNFLFLFFLQL